MIEVSKLTKSYREGRGVRDLTFRIDSGTAFGFLGPNGAGKTTTIRLLMGFMKPDHGNAEIYGLDCWQDKAELKQLIGYLPGELHFLEHLTGLEFLKLLEGMLLESQAQTQRENQSKQTGQASEKGHHIQSIQGKRTSREIRKRRSMLMNALEFDPRQPIRKMSKGMKQKLGVVAALMTDAQVLILDEPTSGLDPLMQKIFIELILEEKKKGKTIFMSSHQFSEIERTCEHVAVIREGKILAVQDVGLLQESELQTYEIEVAGEEDAKLLRESGLAVIPIASLRFEIQVAGNPGMLWQTLARLQIKQLRQTHLELEEAFMQYYSLKKWGSAQ